MHKLLCIADSLGVSWNHSVGLWRSWLRLQVSQRVEEQHVARLSCFVAEVQFLASWRVFNVVFEGFFRRLIVLAPNWRKWHWGCIWKVAPSRGQNGKRAFLATCTSHDEDLNCVQCSPPKYIQLCLRDLRFLPSAIEGYNDTFICKAVRTLPCCVKVVASTWRLVPWQSTASPAAAVPLWERPSDTIAFFTVVCHLGL